MDRTYKIALSQEYYSDIVYLSQYDDEYNVIFNVMDKYAKAQAINGYSAKFVGTRSDKLGFEFTSTAVNDTVTFAVDTTLTGVAGTHVGEIIFYDGNGMKFGSANVKIIVEPAARPNGTIDADVERAQEIAEQVAELIDGATEGAEAWAVGQRGGVDVDSDDETYHNNAKYYAESISSVTSQVATNTSDIADVKADLSDYIDANLTLIQYVPALTKGRYIRQSDGKSQSSNKYARTSVAWYGWSSGRNAISIDVDDYEYCVSYFEDEYNIATGAGYIGNGGYHGKGEITAIPSEAVYFFVTFRRTDQADLTDDDIDAISEALLCYTFTAKFTEKGLAGIVETGTVDKSTGTVKDYYIGKTTGKVQNSAQTVKTLCLECNANAVYKIAHPKSTQFVVASFGVEPSLNKIANKVYDGRNEQVTVFATDPNAKWIGIYYYSSAHNSETAENTYDALTIETYGFGKIAEDVSTLANNAELQENAVGFYTSNDTIPVPSTAAEVFDLYDELVTDYPDYVTKNTLTSGDLTNYEYVFTYGNYNKNQSAQRTPDPAIDKPVILLSSGVHGYEKSSVMSLYKVMKDLCANDFALVDVINYVTVKVIPVGDPYSYDHNQRWNENAVDINRNFATSTWGDYDPGEPGDANYAGPSAGSEDETKILQAWMEDNDDALFYIDFHNSNFVSEVAMLSGPDTEDATAFKKKYLLGMNKIIPYWQKARGIDPTNNYYCYTGGNDTIEGRVSRNYAYEAGIHLAFSHETSWNVASSGKHSQKTLNVGAEAIGNLLIEMNSYYREI